VGQTFFKNDAPAGKNFYGCTAPNVWTVETPPDLPTGQAGQVLANSGSGPVWIAIMGDIAGSPGALAVEGLQGRPVSAANPANGSALEWNGGTNQWEPTLINTTLAGDANGAASNTVVSRLQGRPVSATAPSYGQALKWNVGSSQWEPGLPNVTLAGDANGSIGSTVVSAVQGHAVSAAVPSDGQGLRWNNTTRQWEPGSPNITLSGDASGTAASNVVSGLQGRYLSAAVPADGQALKWNGGSSQWEPGMPNTTLAGDASGAASNTVVKGLQGRSVSNNSAVNGQGLTWDATFNQWEPGTPIITLAGDAQGIAGNTVVKGIQGHGISSTPPANGQALTWSGVTNQWQPAAVPSSVAGDANGPLSSTVVQKLQGRAISAASPTDGQALTWSGALSEWQPGTVNSMLAGDASGPASATVVQALQGHAVSTTIPVDGQLLRWNGTLSQWEPGSGGSGGSTVLAGDASGPSGSTVVKAVQGRAVSSTAPTDGQALKWNATLNQWEATTLAGDAGGAFGSTVVRGLQGRTVAATAPSDGQALRWNASASQWGPATLNVSLAGDATGPTGSTVVQALQGRPVSATAPGNGQTLRWNATSSQWEPAGPAANYSTAFTSQTSIVIPGTAHGYATSNLLVQCYDTGSSIIIPSSVSINATTYDVTIGFVSAHSGRCLVNGGGSGNSGGGGGTSAVVSVFGRNGIVSGQTGDYGFSQITGAVSNAQVGAGIDAGKIGSGTVSSSTFGQLANVRSDVQAQIDGKAALAQTVSGDVSGNLSAVLVTGIQGQPVAATPAVDGQVLTWSAASAQWGPSTPSSSSGSGAVSTLGVSLTSPTVLTIGAGCSAAAPCNVRFGSTVWSIQRPATATIGSGTGMAYVWVDQTGTVTVGHSLSVTCSTGCQAQTGITSFPTDVIPIATWTATSGTWDAQGGTDRRSWLSTNVLSAGQGIMVIDAGGTSTVAVDATVVPTYLKGSAILDFPAIPSGACAAEQAISVPGAVPGDGVAPGWPALLPGLLGTMFVSGTNTVTVRLCNLSGMITDPAIATFSATIIRSF
jgi:hypothetical protein